MNKIQNFFLDAPPHGATPELYDLSGRVAIVTGGAGWLGSAMSEALAERGSLVAVVDIDASGVHRVVESLERRGLRGPAVVGDTMVENALRLLIDTVADEHGRLDILVN